MVTEQMSRGGSRDSSLENEASSSRSDGAVSNGRPNKAGDTTPPTSAESSVPHIDLRRIGALAKRKGSGVASRRESFKAQKHPTSFSGASHLFWSFS